MNESQKVLQATYILNDKIEISQTPSNFENLQETIKKLFNLNNDQLNHYDITYKDKNDKEIYIRNDDSFLYPKLISEQIVFIIRPKIENNYIKKNKTRENNSKKKDNSFNDFSDNDERKEEIKMNESDDNSSSISDSNSNSNSNSDINEIDEKRKLFFKDYFNGKSRQKIYFYEDERNKYEKRERERERKKYEEERGKKYKIEKSIKKNFDFFEHKKYILTNSLFERMKVMIYFIEEGKPILLVGETGTSKTRTSIMVCEYLNFVYDKKYIKYDINQETKIEHLIVKKKLNMNNFHIKYEIGDFLKAFTEGYILILDGINLASKEVLNYIVKAIKNKSICYEFNKELKIKKIHQNFSLIGIKSSLNSSEKENQIKNEFLSIFQIINCGFIEEDLYIIFKRLTELAYINNDKNILERIIRFHFSWEKKCLENSEYNFCFTIREIERVLKEEQEYPFCTLKEEIYSIIMNVYGSRYSNKQKEELSKFLSIYFELKNLKKDDYIGLPEDFPLCFENKNLSRTVNSILISLENKRHVIIIGEEGSGLTQVARWCAEIFSGNEPYLCICTNKMKWEDLLGYNIIKYNDKFKCKQGFLSKAIKKGKCVIFDQINEATSSFFQNLVSLLDIKYNNGNHFSEDFEQINKDNNKFRIISTCNISKLKYISPSLLNRFDIVYLDDQLEGVCVNEDYFYLVKRLFQRFENLEKKIRNKEKKVRFNYFDDTNDSDEFDENINVNSFIIKLIVNKLKILQKGDNNKYFSYYSISSINKFCLAIYKLLLKLKDKVYARSYFHSLKKLRNNYENINEKEIIEIIEIIFDLIFIKNPDEIKISKYPSISEFLLYKITSNELNINYFFQTENLRNFFGIIYLSFLN